MFLKLQAHVKQFSTKHESADFTTIHQNPLLPLKLHLSYKKKQHAIIVVLLLLLFLQKHNKIWSHQNERKNREITQHSTPSAAEDILSKVVRKLAARQAITRMWQKPPDRLHEFYLPQWQTGTYLLYDS